MEMFDPAHPGEIVREDCLIPTIVDQNLWTQSLRPTDMMVHGCAMSLFQASQQWSTMLVYDRKTRFDSQFPRMYCQMFSTGLSSGHFGGSGTMVMFGGTISRRDRCHPAWSTRSTA